MSFAPAEPTLLQIEDRRPAPPRAPAWRRVQGWLREVWLGRTEDDLRVLAAPGTDDQGARVLFFLSGLVVLAAMANSPIQGEVLRWLVPIAAFASGVELGCQWLDSRFGPRGGLMLAKVSIYAATIGVALVAVCSAQDLAAYSKHPLIFLIYLLLIHASAIRDEPRVPLLAGVASLLSFAWVAHVVPDLAAGGGPEKLARLTRDFDPVSVLGHAVVIGCATFGAVGFSRRGQAIRRLSVRDGLTGLANRQVFDACLDLEGQRASRTGIPLSIAMIDVDHFKALNDAHGHAYGDAVLRWVAEVLRETFRASDIVARYGGEEFVVIFVDSADDRLVHRLNAVRERIAGAVLRGSDDEATCGVSVSIGMASWPEDGRTVGEVLRRADECLYLAKDRGRDCVVTSREVDGRR